MSISSAELIALLQGTLPGAAPAERPAIETYIDLIGRQSVTARQDSEKSRFLKRTATDFEAFWQPEIASHLEGVEIYGVEVPLINAFARLEKGCKQVILFEGIQQVALFYAHFITVMNLLNRLRPGRTIEIEGWREKESASFSLAGFSLLYEYMKTGEILIAVGDILGPAALRNTQLGYAATIAFLLAHELGHLVLGHTGLSGAIAERNQAPLAIGQEINQYQQNEFEADRYALFAFREHLRLPVMSSVIFFFGPMAFMEAFVRTHPSTHPLFTNRAAHLASLLPKEGKDAIAVANIIESQIEGFKKTSAMRGESENDIRPRIHRTMPVDLAYKVIYAVKEAVTSEMGVLDVESELQGASEA